MGKTVKIAISLPEELLQAAERESQARGVTRSEFFRQAVEGALERRQDAIERYMRGYHEQPETDDEVVAARQASSAALAMEPWT